MRSRDLPSKEVLDQVLKYVPETGEFFWRPRPVSMFNSGNQVGKRNLSTGPRAGIGGCGARPPSWSAAQWNSRWAGKPASTLKPDGYRYVHFNYRTELAHRIAYKIMTGLDAVEIDHIDGDRSNNKWCNLKNGTRSDNLRNVRLKRSNTSGCHGVSFSKRAQRWVAVINIGTFDSKDEAVAARKKVEALLGYHPNHGRN